MKSSAEQYRNPTFLPGQLWKGAKEDLIRQFLESGDTKRAGYLEQMNVQFSLNGPEGQGVEIENVDGVLVTVVPMDASYADIRNALEQAAETKFQRRGTVMWTARARSGTRAQIYDVAINPPQSEWDEEEFTLETEQETDEVSRGIWERIMGLVGR